MNIDFETRRCKHGCRSNWKSPGSGSVEELLARLLETQEEQDRWLLENRESIDAKIRRGMRSSTDGKAFPKINSMRI